MGRKSKKTGKKKKKMWWRGEAELSKEKQINTGQ